MHVCDNYCSQMAMSCLYCIITAYPIQKIDTVILVEHKEKGNFSFKNYRNIISNYKTKYFNVYISIIIISLISMFYSTYQLVIQASFKYYSLNKDMTGFIICLYYIVCVAGTFVSGYINISEIKKYLSIILLLGISGVFSSLILKNYIFLILLIIYGIYGGFLNTMFQIYFQKSVELPDIIMTKGLYNVFCGITIIIANVFSPIVIETFTLAYVFYGRL